MNESEKAGVIAMVAASPLNRSQALAEMGIPDLPPVVIPLVK